MPTENRSSNTEMVSELLPCPFCGQQDFLIERLDSDASVVICQGLTGPHEACLARGPVGVAQDEGEEQPGRDKAIELWNARAEQHKCGPVALPDRKDATQYWNLLAIGGAEGWNACLDEIAKLGPLYGRPVQGEPVARVEVGPDRNACLTITDNDWLRALKGRAMHQVVPLYPHADPAEVDRLRETLELVREQRDNELRTNSSLERERDALRSQLDELTEAFSESQEEVVKRGKMLAEAQALIQEAANIAMFTLPSGWHKRRAALSATAEPSAPVEIDERAEFERAAAEQGSNIDRNSEGDYVNPWVESEWEGWQARAALERKS